MPFCSSSVVRSEPLSSLADKLPCYTRNMTFTSLYIHIPFCIHRCGYCDFNTYAGLQALIPEYIRALCTEISFLSLSSTERIRIHTVYFGGGTPSLLPIDGLKHILGTIKDDFDLSPHPEITLEANPGTVSQKYFLELHDLGVNRISLGMQSTHTHELTMLERQHSFVDVARAVEWVRQAGIGNLNLDLIYDLPNQTLKSWQASVEAAISLQPEHLSLYALTLEHGTPLQHKVAAGILPEPDGDLAADMYETASESLHKAGYIQYEISNWSRTSQKGKLYSCQHNLQYWRTLPYIGVGAGAHGFVSHYRTVDVHTPRGYINRLDQKSRISDKALLFPRTPATTQMNFIEAETEIGEFMLMGLRLVQEGVSSQEFQERYQMSLSDKFGTQIQRLALLGLLEWCGPKDDRLRLTKKGYLLGNQVFKEFI